LPHRRKIALVGKSPTGEKWLRGYTQIFGKMGAKNLPTVPQDNLQDLPNINLEDESFQDWYRKTSGMHTVEAWCGKYKKHPYAWGALLMIHFERGDQRIKN
jgi:hypothetical protein